MWEQRVGLIVVQSVLMTAKILNIICIFVTAASGLSFTYWNSSMNNVFWTNRPMKVLLSFPKRFSSMKFRYMSTIDNLDITIITKSSSSVYLFSVIQQYVMYL